MKAGDSFIGNRDLKALNQTSESYHPIKVDTHREKDGEKEAINGNWEVEQAYNLDCCDSYKCQKV